MTKETHMTAVLVNYGTTVAFFFLEALIHFNIGKTGNISLRHFPSAHDAIRIISVVMFFAFMATVVSEMINHYIGT